MNKRKVAQTDFQSNIRARFQQAQKRRGLAG
jgi:hypothetical protein